MTSDIEIACTLDLHISLLFTPEKITALAGPRGAARKYIKHASNKSPRIQKRSPRNPNSIDLLRAIEDPMNQL